MHEQIREWLLCCNPSNYTLPLLLDTALSCFFSGRGQTLVVMVVNTIGNSDWKNVE